LEGKALDYVIIVVFLIGAAAFGIITGGKQKTVKDYLARKKFHGGQFVFQLLLLKPAP